jgi:hypothetical protein
MLRRYELVLGFLFGTAFWLVVLALASNTWLAGYVTAITGINANTVIAFASAASAAFALALFLNAHHQLTHNRQVERAYVKISHPSPGIRQVNSDGSIWLAVSIKNYGRTPARVTDVVIKPVVVRHSQSLPTMPDYTMRHEDPKPQAFLISGDEFFLRRSYRITPDEMSKVKDRGCVLYIIGYVDYIDQFDQHHRGGYGREYRPTIDDKARYKTEEEFAQRNNLIVVAQEGYNYATMLAISSGRAMRPSGIAASSCASLAGLVIVLRLIGVATAPGPTPTTKILWLASSRPAVVSMRMPPLARQ